MKVDFFKTRCLWNMLGSLMLLCLTCGYANAGEATLVKNGSFEEEPVVSSPSWNGIGSFWKGGGNCQVTDQDACHGRRSLHFAATKPNSQGQSSSEFFFLIPDRKYRISYGMKRLSDQINGRMSLEFTNGQRSGAFVCHSTDKAINTWQQVGENRMNILFFLPPGSKRQYVVLKHGIFSVPSKIYGRKPVKCMGKVYVQGTGDIFFDKIMIETLENKKNSKDNTLGFKDISKEEAEILLMGAQEKSNLQQAAEAGGQEKYKLELPPSFDVAPIKKVEAATYPAAITNTKFNGARVERNGKPVFLLGAELLSPYLCKMFGMDFWVNSAFGNKVEARLEGDTVKTSLTSLGFLEEQIREHLKSGILVWMDLLQDYKAWHSKVLRDNFPSLFVTREGFFCWRPEEPRAQALRHATWHNALKKSGKYPVFVYEMFNELNYEDHSPYNYRQFRRKMAEKYGTIDRANALWGTSFASFEQVVPVGNDPLMDAVNKQSPQLKAEWSLFTEERFAEIAKDSVNWLRKLVPEEKLSLQSYNGLPFDFQNNYVNPYLVNPNLDLTIAEFDQYIYPQWEGAENEDEILSSMRRDMDVSISRLSAPDNAILDGECRFGAMTKMASKDSIVVNLNGQWQFRPGATISPDQAKTPGYKNVKNQDDGKDNGWHQTNFNDSQWQKITVPGMWGQQGFKSCYVGWYRKAFKVPADGGRLFLSGQKLSDRGDVYLNGKLICQTLKWDEAFSVDITNLVKPGQENVLAIRIYNSYFHDGYFYGGIRDDIHITNVALSSTPITPEQLACGMGLRAFQGYSGLCLSYCYINWMEDWSCSVMNPEKFQPEAVAALPTIKNRINDLAPLIFRKRHQYQDVAVTYSLNSARAYLPKNSTISRERTFDIARYYSGSVFTHRGTDVVSDDVLEDMDKLKQFKALILCRTEAVSEQALKNIRRFAAEGGLVIVDRMSLVKRASDGAPVDVTDLLGVVREKPIAGLSRIVKVKGMRHTFNTIPSQVVDGAHVAPLELRNARAFATAGTAVVGAVRNLGKGRIVTFTPELVGSDYAQIFRQLFEQAEIAPQLDIRGGKFVEVHTRQQNGSHLWAVFNRGKEATLKIAGEVPAGVYQVREAFSDRKLTSPAGQPYWTARDLRQGVTIKARNLSPIYLLIEPKEAEKITLTAIPKGQQEALDKFFLPLWRDMKQPTKRVLWYGYTHYAPTKLPSAAKVMRDMGVAVDFMADRAFNPELKVIRGGKKVVAKLNDYDLVVIPRSRANLTEADCRGLKPYLQQGGNLLLLAGHVFNFHSFYNHRMQGVVKMLNLRVVESAMEDTARQRDVEPRRFDTTNITAHPITEGVKSFAVMGTTGVDIPGGKILVQAEKTARTDGNLPVILTVKEIGNSRIAVCGDVDWLSPDGLVLADNAKLWTNLVGWLCRIKPLTTEEARKSAALPSF